MYDIIIIAVGALAIGASFALGLVVGENRERKLWVGIDRAKSWPKEWDK